jgi:hypothetical protein
VHGYGYEKARLSRSSGCEFAAKQRKPILHAFVLDAISTLSPYTRPMFGCLAIYVKDKIVLILRDKPKSTADNGVWLATTQEHTTRACGVSSRTCDPFKYWANA